MQCSSLFSLIQPKLRQMASHIFYPVKISITQHPKYVLKSSALKSIQKLNKSNTLNPIVKYKIYYIKMLFNNFKMQEHYKMQTKIIWKCHNFTNISFREIINEIHLNINSNNDNLLHVNQQPLQDLYQERPHTLPFVVLKLVFPKKTRGQIKPWLRTTKL